MTCMGHKFATVYLRFYKSIEVMLLTIILVTLFLSFSFNEAENSTLYIKPTNLVGFKCNECHTLNEWIKNGSSPFTNDTTVILLAGVHFINSTKDSLDIEDVHSLVITGEQDQTTLYCGDDLKLNFKICVGINISQIKFNSCILTFSYLQDVKIDNTMIFDGELQIKQHHPEVNECMIGEQIKNAKYINISISNSILHNSSINQVKTESDYPSFSCFQLDIYSVVIRNLKRLNSITAINIWVASMVKLSDITFCNNSSPLLRLQETNILKFIGNNKIEFNIGQGIDIFVVGVVIMKHSKIEICNNFNSMLIITLVTNLDIRNSTISIKNNTSERGIMTLNDVKNTSFIHSKLIFMNNTCLQLPFNTWGAVMLLQSSQLYLFSSTLLFRNNSAPLSGGITFIKSDTTFTNSSAVFEYNQGGNGGAMAFYQGSGILAKTWLKGCDSQHKRPNCSITDDDNCYPVHCKETIDLYFHFNNAHKGGAIFIEDSDYVDLGSYDWPIGTVEFSSEDSLNYPNAFLKYTFYLLNNSAELAGNEIHGGWIDLPFHDIHFSISSVDMNAVASDPTRICKCVNSNPSCNITEHQEAIFPGQSFKIEAVAVGQRMGIVPSTIYAELSDEEGSIDEEQSVQTLYKRCTTLVFTIYSAEKFKILNLTTKGVGISVHEYLQHKLPLKYHVLFQQFSINVRLKRCPPGFVFSTNRCVCAPLINSHSGIECEFSNYTILKTKQKWLFTTSEHNSTQDYGIIVHDYCPYDYCIYELNKNHSSSFHLEFPDDQCAFQRSGVLCGACKENFSQVLGSSKCTKCSESNFMLLIILFGTFLSGIILVGFLMLFNITVSIGSINGLIFYANIIRANYSIFPSEFSSSFLSIFIAWLNLDLGVETCFYNGLDAYSKTWLQFAFPLYIWILVTIIVVASHYSTIVSRLTPNNSLQVLATLFLLSYTKILRVVITVFSFTDLVYPDGFTKRVWLYDGNIEFLRGKHIPLFISTLLLLLVLSIPYTLSLISIQWLQRISHYRMMSWVHRLMPLFDACTGPYKDKHRYWTGLLLFVRVIVIIVFSLNLSNNPSINLLSTAMISFALLAYLSHIGGVYIDQFIYVLEIASILNLGVVSVFSLYQFFNNKSAVLCIKVSTSFAFVLFLVIIAYHIIKRLMSLTKVRTIKCNVAESIIWSRVNRAIKLVPDYKPIENDDTASTGIKYNDFTHSSIKLASTPE